MPDMPRTKFNSPWTVENIEAELNGTKNARGNLTMTEKLAQKVETSVYDTDKAVIDAEIAEDRAALVELVDGGAKNLLQFTGASTSGKNGLTYDIQDGIVTVSGTPTDPSASSYVILQLGGTGIDASEFCDGNHVLSGCPSGGSAEKYKIYVVRGSSYIKSDYGDGVLLDATTLTSIYLAIAVYPDYYPTLAQTPLVFRPMICTAADWAVSKKFVPYCPTLYELYQMILALQNGA